MAPSSLLSLLLPLAIITLFHRHAILLASASSTIQCRSGWTNTLQTITPSQMNDYYCDCPYDGLDEQTTGACSGSMDGMWSGIPPKHESSDYDAARSPAYFVCPQQPSLRLPLSRVNDDICDCCDGADESSATSPCPDICDQVLAEERHARAKAKANYEIGSRKRMASISQYQTWFAETERKLVQLKEVDLLAVTKQLEGLDASLVEAKVSFARKWMYVVNEEVLAVEPLREMFGDNNSMMLDDLASFVISLCWLSAEVSSGNFVNDRCVALDRASLDLGILWDYQSDSDNDDSALPSFNYLDSGTEAALVDFAEKIILRLEGKDTKKDYTSRRNSRQNTKPKSEPVEYDSGDDPYGDDWEDHHDHDYGDMYDDDYVGEDYHSEEDQGVPETEGEAEVKEEEPQLSPNEILVKTLLDNVPLDRNRELFKGQSKVLLNYSLEVPKDSDDAAEGDEGEELSAEHENDQNGNQEAEEEDEEPNGSGVDPMALQMVKSAINKRLSNIARGETSAKSAARFIASVMENSDSALSDMKKLAIMMTYHSKIATGDVAELIYSTSNHFRPADASTEGEDESFCSAPWSNMCPPRTVPIQNGDKSYPPPFIVEAAQERCEQRENSIGICAVQEEDEIEIPATLSDGYYNYYEPQSVGPDDDLAPYFSSVDSLHKMPTNIVDLKNQREAVEKEKNAITKGVADLERETGGSSSGGSKYGSEGDLYIMRDTCHKVESGKYEYEVCIFGKATQRDIGQNSGGTNLGSWDTMEIEDGQRTLKWGKGTKCWNGPERSAEVSVTCGSETKVLTADEPETCKYVFTMESPLGCDEQFKIKNSL